ncbi:hypothetical protein ARSEF1564_010192, partial [Beauveria bassiana]
MDAKGDIDRYFPFDCTGAKLPLGFSERQRFNGEEPPKYDILDSKKSKPNVCASYNIRGGKAGETVQRLDVAKEPKLTTSADGQATAQENQPAALRLQQQCADIGRLIFFACRRKSGEVDGCYQQFREAFEDCLGVSARSPTETTLRTAWDVFVHETREFRACLLSVVKLSLNQLSRALRTGSESQMIKPISNHCLGQGTPSLPHTLITIVAHRLTSNQFPYIKAAGMRGPLM